MLLEIDLNRISFHLPFTASESTSSIKPTTERKEQAKRNKTKEKNEITLAHVKCDRFDTIITGSIMVCYVVIIEREKKENLFPVSILNECSTVKFISIQIE